jgi:hypothetical protein
MNIKIHYHSPEAIVEVDSRESDVIPNIGDFVEIIDDKGERRTTVIIKRTFDFISREVLARLDVKPV